MKYNDIQEVQVVTDVTVEPVALDELKRHMNMLFDTDGSFTFDDDDTLLNSLITTARQSLEKYTGLSFAPKDLRAIIRNECGGSELPGGPIIADGDVTSVKDIDGNALIAYNGSNPLSGGTYRLKGNQFKEIMYPCSCYLDFVYTAGYAAGTIPEPLKRAIMEQCQFMYDNRGGQVQLRQGVVFDICTSAKELAAPYKRVSILA